MIKVYKENIIEALKRLSDINYQRIAWFPNDEGIVDSYDENVMGVFDDTGLEHALEQGEIVFGKDADDALRDLNDEVERIGYYRPESELINLPKMQIVREKAAKALKLILASDGKESTVEIV